MIALGIAPHEHNVDIEVAEGGEYLLATATKPIYSDNTNDVGILLNEVDDGLITTLSIYVTLQLATAAK